MSSVESNFEVLRPRTAADLRDCFARLRVASRELAKQPFDQFLELLDELGRRWRPGTAYHQQAVEMMSGMLSRRAVEAALAGLVLGLSPAALAMGLRHELGRTDLLETWQADERGIGLVRGYPLGVVAQILAGNVFLGGVIALSQSLLTHNAVVLKLSREDSGFTSLFAKALHEVDRNQRVTPALAVCAWDSREEEFNEVVRGEADGIVVWGGAAAVAAYPAERCRGRVIHYGPRLGIGMVLAGVDLEQALPALAWDVALWEQQACSSPRLVLVEDPDQSLSLPRRVARELSAALTKIRAAVPSEGALALMSAHLGFDFSRVPLEEPIRNLGL
ncbi:MAG: aldehyde dehydrogenase family protein, partial [Planctomycetes bacterium]|nr:aldehyde dehydrogenase family protein [Planctomycetota bacterium]